MFRPYGALPRVTFGSWAGPLALHRRWSTTTAQAGLRPRAPIRSNSTACGVVPRQTYGPSASMGLSFTVRQHDDARRDLRLARLKRKTRRPETKNPSRFLAEAVFYRLRSSGPIPRRGPRERSPVGLEVPS